MPVATTRVPKEDNSCASTAMSKVFTFPLWGSIRERPLTVAGKTDLRSNIPPARKVIPRLVNCKGAAQRPTPQRQRRYDSPKHHIYTAWLLHFASVVGINAG